ncbi:lysozyme inhibitor LprI family protein [Lactonifactor longoviformis]|uniref:lysozyme inhibitor LprI family protein n=1 Tax=Lactonifactor longoviformis TaxID=341220 RepID=UPI001D00BC76|nr:lysozyme inhibitor LprI family protein [Lactonifactor longoviformis]MCB5711472.1 lysozyme inhibitor LprI family protein [Lactonifactor longoviformis]MCB5715439.1 lysozyme inhibitor LprI family protein [Lactonifactor longoviformis]
MRCPKKWNKKLILPVGIGGTCMVLVIVLGVIWGVNQTKAGHLQEKLDLGNKYLDEMDYDQAKAAFDDAADIDPSNADAYVGLTKACRGLKDEEGAKKMITIAMEKIGDLPEEERAAAGEILYAEAETIYAETEDLRGADALKQWADDNKIPVKPSKPSDTRDEETDKDKPAQEAGTETKPSKPQAEDPHQVYMDYVKNTLSTQFPFSEMKGATAEYPNLEALGTQEEVNNFTTYTEEYQKTLKAQGGILGIAYADMDNDGADEMAVLYTRQIPEEYQYNWLQADIYKAVDGQVRKLEGEELRVPCRNTFPSEGNKEKVQAFLKVNSGITYLGFISHTYGVYGTSGERTAFTQFLLGTVENGKVVCRLHLEEDTGVYLRDILAEKREKAAAASDDQGAYVQGKLLVDMMSDGSANVKDRLYQELSPYGFFSSWMDSYFEEMQRKKLAAENGILASLEEVKSPNPFEEKLSGKEKDTTDLASVTTEVTGYSQARPAFAVVQFDSTDETKLAENKEKYGFDKSVTAGAPAAGTLKKQYQEEIAQIESKCSEIYTDLQTNSYSNAEMGQKCTEIYNLWDGELNKVYQELMNHISPQEQEALKSEEKAWIESKEDAVEALREEYQGGTILVTEVPGKMAQMTKERVYELADRLPET